MDKDDMDQTSNYFLEKLNISDEEFNYLMKSTPHQHTDYKIDYVTKVIKFIRLQGK